MVSTGNGIGGEGKKRIVVGILAGMVMGFGVVTKHRQVHQRFAFEYT